MKEDRSCSMEIINLTHKQPSVTNRATSFAINFKELKEIWIFNCFQGCQNVMNRKQVKINQISKIIITELGIKQVSGLMGLLSSLSLIGRKKEIHLYSPRGLENYLALSKKYSQTNFRYNLYVHILTAGIIINNDLYKVYTFATGLKFNFLLILHETYGKFKSDKAKRFNLISGPLYGQLKQGKNFLAPDGIIVKSQKFTKHNKKGKKFTYLIDQYCGRNYLETQKETRIIQQTLQSNNINKQLIQI
uniref:conserved hypothetical plastid protein n=1 Tax=Gloiopeltis furcata TaxID=42017 RepID=UPI0028D00609|nr:conserved hypothetical plastid protein [Gloiopeltis furcata]WMP13993.1 conserved hypothetical plastid protein [Gloiopeltis furcata]